MACQMCSQECQYKYWLPLCQTLMNTTTCRITCIQSSKLSSQCIIEWHQRGLSPARGQGGFWLLGFAVIEHTCAVTVIVSGCHCHCNCYCHCYGHCYGHCRCYWLSLSLLVIVISCSWLLLSLTHVPSPSTSKQH